MHTKNSDCETEFFSNMEFLPFFFVQKGTLPSQLHKVWEEFRKKIDSELKEILPMLATYVFKQTNVVEWMTHPSTCHF